MRALSRRIVRLLRSRRLAVGLIAGLAAYGVIVTLVPRGAPNDPKVLAWAAAHPFAEAIAKALSLHQAYSSPLFLALAALLAACTAACAIERTRRVRTLMRTTLHLSDSSLERLRDHPQTTFSVAPDIEPESALGAAADGPAKAGLRVGADGASVDGRSGVVGLLGSPLFHWALVALIVVVALGQATRSEGFVALPLGVPVAEQHANYLQITEGPLFRECHTGVLLEAVKIDRNYTAGGVSYGPTPLVTASRGGIEIASGEVHPNSPLRVGPLMIHMAALGPAVTLSLESHEGAEIGRDVFALDLSTEASSGSKPQRFTLPGGPGFLAVTARVQVLVHKASATESSAPIVSRAILEIATAGSDNFGPPVMVAEGDAIDLPDGRRLRVAKVSDWVRVSVANDWSVPFIYGLLITAILGLGLAVLVPTRRASVLLVKGEEGYALHLGTWHARGDTLFKRHVIEVVRSAAEEVESP